MYDFETRPLTEEIIDRFANKPYWICMYAEDYLGTTGTYFSMWYVRITSGLNSGWFDWEGIPAMYLDGEPDDFWSTPSSQIHRSASPLEDWEIVTPLEAYAASEILELVEVADALYDEYLEGMI